MTQWLTDWRYEARGLFRWIRWGGIAMVAFLIIAGIVVGATWIITVNNNRQDAQEIGTTSVPLSTYTVSAISAFNSISGGYGADDSAARRYLLYLTAENPLIYPSTLATDPGTDLGDGRRQVTLSENLTDTEWRAIAAAATLNGQVLDSNVPEENVAYTTTTATFPVPGTGLTGVMVLSADGKSVALTEIRYEGAE